ncbi:MAG: matrixin family metalloprotease [Leadbetterella sp.]|nr:matrixin family metalloprotease [Leadbetterella sp.]
MKKTYLAGLVVIAIIALGIVVVPKTMAEKQTKGNRSVKIEGATPENPVVSLGKAFDKKSGKMVDGYAIVHYAKNASKPAKPSSGTTCYGYIAKGAKWKGTPEPWFIDSYYNGDLGVDFVLPNMVSDITKWESAAGAGIDILGEGTSSAAPITISNLLNDKNEVTFATINNAGVIAATYIWGYFSGPIFQRELVEWDQVYNDKYQWTVDAKTEPTKMDFENIATHELGHSVGMGDLYNSSCSEQTMYGYANYGQTDKRDLNTGDITGIDLLY